MAPAKPEAALAKAKDLINVSKLNTAIEILSECMKAQKKQKAWVKTHEEVMMLLAQLCVDNKKSLQFKEIIHQYKNMTFQMVPKSLEDVVKYYLSLAKQRTEEARNQAKILVPDIDDLDNPDTPENLMLSAINADSEQERQDKAILTPWLKFLWESYRQCMELLRNNVKFERLYHDIAQETFEFCQKYDRKAEFRKLSEILRNHMSKFQSTNTIGNTSQTQTPETWVLHLETRLKMLDFALKFELYNEAFKAVEDVWNLLNTSNIAAKPRILANYYLKTSYVFFESGTSYLFHAAALHKLFFYSRENKKNMSQVELEQLALQLIIATLAVPLPNNREPIDPLLESGEITNPVKQKTLSMLLNLPAPPTRASLIKDIQDNHIYNLVSPEIASFFKILESDYKPLSMAKDAPPILKWLREHPDFNVYSELIQNIVVSKTIIQIGKVYKTIKINEFEKLCPCVEPLKLQTIVFNLIRNLELPIRIDHKSGIIEFDVYTDLGISQRNDTNLISQEINNICTYTRQLSKFSTAIYEVAEHIGYVNVENQQNRDWTRQCYIKKIKECHQTMLNRKNLIEARKEEIERVEAENQEKLNDQLRIQDEKRRIEEKHRLLKEQEQLARKKMEEQKEMQQKKIIKAKITYLKSSDAGNKVLKNFTEKELEEMDDIKLVKMQCDEKNRIKEEEEEKFRKLEQKVDYFQRALRLEEIPRINQVQLEVYENAKKMFDAKEEKRRNDSRDLHVMRLKDKELCLRLQSDIENYIQSIVQESDEKSLKEWEERNNEIKQAYREKRMAELLEEKTQEDLIKQKELEEENERIKEENERIKEENERIKEEMKAKVEPPKAAYIPPYLRRQAQETTSDPVISSDRSISVTKNFGTPSFVDRNRKIAGNTDSEVGWNRVMKR